MKTLLTVLLIVPVLPLLAQAEQGRSVRVASVERAHHKDALLAALAADDVQAVSALYAHAGALCKPGLRKGKHSARVVNGALMREAARCDASAVVAWLLSVQKADPHDMLWDNYGHPLGEQLSHLHVAAMHGSLRVAKQLADAGVNLDMVNQEGNTALMLAAASGAENAREMVCLLGGLGANLSLRNYAGQSAVDMVPAEQAEIFDDLCYWGGLVPRDAARYAEWRKQKEAAPGAQRTPQQQLWHAVVTDNVPMAQEALSHGASLQTLHPLGNTHPMRLAISHGNEAMVRLLLSHGDTFHRSWDDYYANLYAAVLCGNPAVLDLMPYHEPKEDEGRESPLMVALRGNAGPVMVAALLERGAARCKRSRLCARECSDWQVLRLYTKDEQSMTLLAAMEPDWSLAVDDEPSIDADAIRKQLATPGLYAIDKRGMWNTTPLGRAREEGNAEAVQLLLAAGADEAPLSCRRDALPPADTRVNTQLMQGVQQALADNNVDYFRTLAPNLVNANAGPVRCAASAFNPTPSKGKYYEAAPIKHVAAAGKTDMLRVLIARGADLEQPDVYGHTAMVYAAANGHVDCVRLLLNAGAKQPTLALQIATRCGHQAVVDYLLSRGVRRTADSLHPPVNTEELQKMLQRTPTGGTSLMSAVQDDDVARAAIILTHAPHLINLQNADGETALMFSQSAQMVKLLHVHGADLALKNDRGYTALDATRAARCGAAEHALLECGAPFAQPQVALRFACAEGDAALVQQLLQDGQVDVNARGETEASLLALAARANAPAVVQLLLEHGAVASGSGALAAAVSADAPSLVRMLMQHEHLCRPAVRVPREGFSEQNKLNALLHAACSAGAVQTVRMLLQMGADVNDCSMTSYAPGVTGNTPLHDAALKSPELLMLLLDAGADINARNAEGDTPLMLVLRYPRRFVLVNADILLARGADVTLLNHQGLGVADLPCYDENFCALLKAKGAQPTPWKHELLPIVQQALNDDNPAALQAALQAGANPNEPLRDGRSLLRMLADQPVSDEAPENEVFHLLVQHGAHMDDALFARVCGWGNVAMMQAMLEGGFRIQPRGAATYEYLRRALHGHRPQAALPLLLLAGADINATDARGYTLLMNMAESPHFIDRNMTELLKHHPNLEVAVQGSTDAWNGLTALSLALRHGNAELAWHLLHAGAKASPHEVQTIFFHILRHAPEHAQEMLTRHGASPTSPEPVTGLTPMDIATRSGNELLISILDSAGQN